MIEDYMIAIRLQDRYQHAYTEILPGRWAKINADARAAKDHYTDADLDSIYTFVQVDAAGRITDYLR